MKTKVINSSVDTDELCEYCTANLEFDCENKTIMPYPCIMCGFYDGRHICYYLMSFLLFLHCSQRYDGNKNLFEKILKIQLPCKIA